MVKCSLCPERLEPEHIIIHKSHGPICPLCNLHLFAVKYEANVKAMLAVTRRQ